MKIVKRVVSLALVALGVWNASISTAAPAQLQQEVDYETDTVGILTDTLPQIQIPGIKVAGEVIRERLTILQKKIPLVYHEVSHYFVEYFINTKPEFTQRMMEQKTLYFPIYEKALAKHNLPDELKYLSMIESGLNPKIISYAGAGGLWQFMRATGREFGLHQDSYIDERFDPEKSTEAACRYLRQLYKIFGDWEMALASYNAGPGNVKRAMRRSGGDTFWSVYDALPKQTRGYVPQFVAILYMMNYGEDHGIKPRNIEYPVVTDTLHINGYLNLPAFCSLSGITMEEIQKLNPQIISTVLPDHTRNFILKVPAEKFAVLRPQRLAIVDSASRRNAPGVMLASNESGDHDYATKRVSHTVRSGETLTSVAQRYGVSVGELKKWNRMRSTRLLRGQRLTIVRQVRVAKPKPSVETRLASVKTKSVEEHIATRESEDEEETEELVADAGEAVVEKAKAPKAQVAAKPSLHTVQRGENLTMLANRYGVTVSDLKEWNDLASGKIMLGQKLQVSNGTKVVAGKDNTVVVASVKKTAPQIKPRYHTVQRGDTLWTISQRYGLTIDKIKQANKMKSNDIKAGMKLLITG
jgi:membrane-bound lytic murein transglycosylase D